LHFDFLHSEYLHCTHRYTRKDCIRVYNMSYCTVYVIFAHKTIKKFAAKLRHQKKTCFLTNPMMVQYNSHCASALFGLPVSAAVQSCIVYSLPTAGIVWISFDFTFLHPVKNNKNAYISLQSKILWLTNLESWGQASSEHYNLISYYNLTLIWHWPLCCKSKKSTHSEKLITLSMLLR